MHFLEANFACFPCFVTQTKALFPLVDHLSSRVIRYLSLEGYILTICGTNTSFYSLVEAKHMLMMALVILSLDVQVGCGGSSRLDMAVYTGRLMLL
jgi:hypothetical protein